MRSKTLWMELMVEIMEAEDRISEVEDTMVEISEAEMKKELKEMRTTSACSISGALQKWELSELSSLKELMSVGNSMYLIL